MNQLLGGAGGHCTTDLLPLMLWRTASKKYWALLLSPVISQRNDQPVPEEFTAPLELPQEHFGLVDDYGIKPRHPKFRTSSSRKESKDLHEAHKSKRDEPDFEEYYYDDNL